MNPIIQKIVLLLSDPTITDKQFLDAQKALMGPQMRECLEQAQSIRRQLKRGADRKRPQPENEEVDVADEQAYQETERLYQEAERLLLLDANLTVRDAISALAVRLGTSAPPTPKRSFREWVSIWARDFGGPRLLSVAQQIKNQKVEGVTPTWPLQEGKSDANT